MEKPNTPLNYVHQYTSKTTVRNIKLSLRKFFKVVYGEDRPVEELAERYVSDDRDHEYDMQEFLAFLVKEDYAPKTVRALLSYTRTFLVENGVELSQSFWRRVRTRIKGSRAVTMDEIPTPEILRKIVSHLPIQGRALTLIWVSSGMRRGELIDDIGKCLTLDDLDLDSDPAKVSIRAEYTKTGNARVTFVSREAREALLEWLKVREDYLKAAVGRSHLYDKSMDDPRLFPFKDTTAYKMWSGALRKSGLNKRDPRTKYHVYHVHTLRKFFRTKLGAVISPDVVEALMGHEQYLEQVYRRYSVEDLAKFYKEGEPALLIFTESGEVSKLREDVQKQKDHLQALLNGVTAENMTLRARVEQQALKLETLEAKHNRMVRKVERMIELLQQGGG